MKKLDSRIFVLLGSGIVFLGILLFVVVLALVVPNTQKASVNLDEESITSRYIADNTVVIESEEEIEVDPQLDLKKQGVLEVDESRKVVKIGRVLSLAERNSLEEKFNIEFTNDTDSNGIYVLIVSDESNLQSFEETLNVKTEVDIPVKMSADVIDWGITRIGADKVWSSGSGVGIKVAIVDTGVQKDHPDLVSNILVGYDFVNNDSDSNDDNGHGTHVAGITAATLNQAGTVGVSNGAKILPVKVLNSQGYGYLSDVAKGIYFATDNGARVINLSLGSTTDSLLLRDAANYASGKGVLIVAAAGNDSGAPCSYPASYSNVICVMASDSRNMLASFSNIGGELTAPGVYNYSTYLGSTYRYLSGTSMASPHVAGASALLFSICPTCSSSEIRTILRDSAIDLGEPGKDILFGYGLIDLTSAVAMLAPVEPEPVPVVEPTPETPQENTQESKPSTTPSKPSTPTPPKESKRIAQSVVILEPAITKANKYIPTTAENLTVKYTLDPVLSDSTLSRVILYLDNEEITFSTEQSSDFIISQELLNHSQHWIKVEALFSDGERSNTQLIIDMTYLRSLEKSSSNTKKSDSVLGISTSIFDWFRFF